MVCFPAHPHPPNMSGNPQAATWLRPRHSLLLLPGTPPGSYLLAASLPLAPTVARYLLGSYLVTSPPLAPTAARYPPGSYLDASPPLAPTAAWYPPRQLPGLFPATRSTSSER